MLLLYLKISYCCNELFLHDFPDTVDMHVDCTNKLQVDSMLDALSFATESSNQIQDLLTETKGALSRLFSMMFPKLDQSKTLGEMAYTLFVDSSEAIEVLKRPSRLYGAVLTFQLLMGHGFGSGLEQLSKALLVDANGCLALSTVIFSNNHHCRAPIGSLN
jgi:hypothetical protein